MSSYENACLRGQVHRQDRELMILNRALNARKKRVDALDRAVAELRYEVARLREVCELPWILRRWKLWRLERDLFQREGGRA